MTEPLRVTVVVQCVPAAAFRLWTERLGTWWPADHTVSGNPASVILEGHVGGRLYERTSEGTEHDWGVVTTWDPPSRLGYTWYLGSRPEDATDVEITFAPGHGDTTAVGVVHRGWERLGEDAEAWRQRNHHGWETLMPHFTRAARALPTSPDESSTAQEGATT